ncbi:MAG: hypothetical protein ABJK37_16155 [Paraglaciecola sp.]|uniref:hypothetical protein n=1 Tax=Paraglaciecola sp. TaxID=1920173 RepID=UPI003298D24E
MNLKITTPLVIVLCAVAGISRAEESYDFTLGTGFPFVFTPELSITTQDNSYRYYLNGKVGVANGASLGFEHSVSENRRHAIGAFAGTVGLYEGESCPESDSVAQGLACSIAKALDWEAIDGIGVSYSYNFQNMQGKGWKLRFEAGYGNGRNSGEKSSAGNVFIGYQF